MIHHNAKSPPLAAPSNSHQPSTSPTDNLNYGNAAIILLCIIWFILLLSLLFKRLEKEGFFSTGNPSQEDLDIENMEQGFVVRNGNVGGKKGVLVIKRYGTMQGYWWWRGAEFGTVRGWEVVWDALRMCDHAGVAARIKALFRK